MHKISDRSAPVGSRDSGDKDRSANSASRRKSKSSSAKLILLANKKRKLFLVLRQYGVIVEKTGATSEWSTSVTCPFAFHKGGNERTPSFGYNFAKDSFHCFGCGAAGGSVDFIALKEGLDKTSVAEQILQELGVYDIDDEELQEDNSPKIENLLFEFSGYLSSLYQKYKNQPHTIEQIDKVVWWFDHYLNNCVSQDRFFVEELESRILKAKEVLREYYE